MNENDFLRRTYNRKYSFDIPWISIFFVVVILVVVITILTSIVGGAFPHYSDGERTGVVYKISKKGFIWKSYEGEMNLGGMATDSNGQVVPNRFEFSVVDTEVAKRIEEASRTGKRVTLVYNQYGIKPISISTDYVITDVKFTESR
jgi:hypothetical protein